MKLPAIFSKKLCTTEKMSLAQWILRAYCNRILLALLCLTIVCVGLYFVTHAIDQRQRLATQQRAAAEAKQYTQLLASRMSQQLAAIAHAATFVQNHSTQLISQNHLPPGAAQSAYLGAALDPVYRGMEQSNPFIAQVYFSTDDALRLRPRHRQTLARYKQAAALQMPGRSVVWTGIYQDKATQGWISSALAAVYSAGQLHGIAGVDVRLDRLLREQMALHTTGYAMLLDQDGKIVAMPACGERHWGQVAASRLALDAANIKLHRWPSQRKKMQTFC